VDPPFPEANAASPRRRRQIEARCSTFPLPTPPRHLRFPLRLFSPWYIRPACPRPSIRSGGRQRGPCLTPHFILIRVRQKTVDLPTGIGPDETTVFGERDFGAGETTELLEQLRLELLLPRQASPQSLWATSQSLQSDTTGSSCSDLSVRPNPPAPGGRGSDRSRNACKEVSARGWRTSGSPFAAFISKPGFYVPIVDGLAVLHGTVRFRTNPQWSL
jgi:hypothetical protein